MINPSRAALADELEAALTTFLNATRNARVIAGAKLTDLLWNNKAGIVAHLRDPLPPTLNSGAVTREELLDRNWKDAKEFCEGAFGPFVTDVSQYTKIVSELMEHATDRALTGRGEIRTALQIALEQATEAFDYAKSKDDHALCEMRYSTIEDALAALSHPNSGDGK